MSYKLSSPFCKNHDEHSDRILSKEDEIYRERNRVVAAFAWALVGRDGYTVGVTRHDDTDPNWDKDWLTILVISHEVFGQMTWHFAEWDKFMLYGLPYLPNYRYDGHSTPEKYQRLDSLSRATVDSDFLRGIELFKPIMVEEAKPYLCRLCICKPCVALKHGDNHLFTVYCPGCQTSGPPDLTRALAVERWNLLHSNG